MNIIIDACSVINLYNAQCLGRVCHLQDHEFWIGPIALGECSGACAAEVWNLIQSGLIAQLQEGEIDGERYLDLLDELGLGPGETECIAAAEVLGFSVCTDDGLARRAALDLLGEDRRLGTARLLQWSVIERIMDCGEANERFTLMKLEGGYLPTLVQGFFCGA